jgi:hypothetical protein
VNCTLNFLSDDELKKYPIKDWVDGWFFRVLEVYPNFYRIDGINEKGRSVSREGSEINLSVLIETCKKDAQEISNAMLVREKNRNG